MADSAPAKHIFLSYAREDRERVQAVAAALVDEGWQVWWDRDNLPPGKRFHRVIEEAIEAAACMLVFWSKHSIDSDWVIDEANEGKALDKLLPVVLDGSRPPYGFRSRHYVDFDAWDGRMDHDAYRRLVRAISDYLPRPAVSTPAAVTGKAETAIASGTESDDVAAQGVSRQYPAKVWEQLQEQLQELDDPDTPPARRLEIGDEWGRLGDFRSGVGLDEQGLPEIDWVEIPAGPFLYGEDKEPRELPAFFIARYPVTHMQFEAFVADGGYDTQADWWEELADRANRPRNARWTEPNRPRETVSWFEAVAFCRWLSNRLGYTVRLPTEFEWEKAARGQDGREYPWGDGYRGGSVNVAEIAVEAAPAYLEQTAAVGLYPHAASPYGVEDLSGNVWEWCLNEYDDPDRSEMSGGAARALRGGSWSSLPHAARASFRNSLDPGYRDDFIGFRLMCSSPTRR